MLKGLWRIGQDKGIMRGYDKLKGFWMICHVNGIMNDMSC